MKPRLRFCGAIGGSVTRRPGETPEDALARAEQAILKLLDRHAKRLGFEGSGHGPNVGLELEDAE